MNKTSSILFLFLLAIVSCKQPVEDYPENVQKVLGLAGNNRQELEKVIQSYRIEGDTLKLKAAYFLIGNMADQSYMTFAVADSNDLEIGFNVLDYPDYNALAVAWDSIVAEKGPLHQKRTSVIKDYEVITADFLMMNIDIAFDAWTNPWAEHLSFEQFCEYILPYRSTNEPLEDWRWELANRYGWLYDSISDPFDPVEACVLINNDIRSWFRFDPRFYEHATDQGYKEMNEGKLGRCEDMTNLAIYAMRAMGVPVMSDFTPYWAKTGNNHAWNAVLKRNGDVAIFMGGESNPGVYRLNQDKAKVYRKTFAVQDGCLATLLEEGEEAPPYINRNNIVDVTAQYAGVADVPVLLKEESPAETRFGYLCVFNAGEWKAIHWSRIEGMNMNFTGMGIDIVYLPAYYINRKITPAGTPLLLTGDRKVVPLLPDREKPVTLFLRSTTKRVTKNTTDNVEKVFLEKGQSYELFFWENGWVSAGSRVAGEGPLVFREVPSGALYWLVSGKPDKDRPERIFLIDEKGGQVWY